MTDIQSLRWFYDSHSILTQNCRFLGLLLIAIRSKGATSMACLMKSVTEAICVCS